MTRGHRQAKTPLVRRLIIHALVVVVVLAAPLFQPRFVPAATPSASSSQALLDRYSALKTKLGKNHFGIPLYLESTEKFSSLQVNMYGIFAYPFERVRDSLQTPDNWCDINLLLINIKACTSRQVADQRLLTLYSGRKYYQLPKDAFKLDLSFHVAAAEKGYLNIELAGKNGPLGTRDHRIRFEAAPIDNDRTFIHFRYDYSFGLPARAAMAGYYATIGRNKKGFSVRAIDKRGNPVYVNGPRGSLERTAVRSYFAIQTFMDTLGIPANRRFEQRIRRWYELTERFPRQLHELGKGEYLANKRREHRNQLMLQENPAR